MIGGHLDTTYRGWSATLATRVRLVIALFLLPLDFHGRLRVVRSTSIPGAFHGIEASFLADTCLRKLRSAVFKVVWSRRQPLASFVGTILVRFQGCIGLLDSVTEGCPGHGPVHLLVASAVKIV